MKYCTKCGKELSDEATICMGCGCPIEVAESSVNTQSTVSANTKAPTKKLSALHIILIVVAAAVIIGGIFGFITVKNNMRIDEIREALEGNHYACSDYSSYTVTRLSFKENYQCRWYKYYAYTSSDLEYTYQYTIELDGDDAYVVINSVKYEVDTDSYGEVESLTNMNNGDVYD